MGLAEGVAHEVLHRLPDRPRRRPVRAAPLRPFEEPVPELPDLLPRAPLRDRPAQDVRLLQGEAGHRVRHLQDVLLVEHHPEGLLEDPPEPLGKEGERLLPRLPHHVTLLHAARGGARPDEGERHHGVPLVLRGEHRQEVPGAGRFHLEAAQGAGGGEEPPGPFVLLGDRVEVEVDPVVPFHGPHRVRHRGEGTLAEEIDLHQAQLLHRVLVVLRDHVPPRRALHGQVVRDLRGGDHDAPGVNGEMAGEPREPVGDAEDRAPGLPVEREAPALREGARRGSEGPGGETGQPFRDPGDLPGGEAQRLRDLPERRPAPEGVPGGDHRRPVPPVGLEDVVDHLAPPLPREIQVDVGRIGAGAVQEALEVEVEGDGVHAREPQAVRDEGVRGRAAPHHGDSPLPREPGEVVHDEEVLREAEVLDDRELLLEPPEHLRPEGAVSARGPLEAELGEERVGGLALRNRELREEGARPRHLEAAAVRDLQGVPERLRARPEPLRHLLPGGEEGGGRGQGRFRHVPDEPVSPDREEHAQEGPIPRARVTDRTRGDHGQAELPGQGRAAGRRTAGQLHVEPAARQLRGQRPEQGLVVREDEEAAGPPEQRPLQGELLREEMAAGDDAAEAPVALPVRDEEDRPGRPDATPPLPGPRLPDAGPEDRAHPRPRRRREEREEAVGAVGIREGQGLLSVPRREGEELLRGHRPLEERGAAVDVEMDETGRGSHPGLPLSPKYTPPGLSALAGIPRIPMQPFPRGRLAEGVRLPARALHGGSPGRKHKRRHGSHSPPPSPSRGWRPDSWSGGSRPVPGRRR